MRALRTAAAGLALLGGVAGAQERSGYQQIAAGDFVGARVTLEAEGRTYPRRPDLMLNLAALHRRDGRVAEARALYRDVLARGDTAMDMPDGSVASSHALARAALAGLEPLQVTAR